jgi:hypothetical protein
MTKDNDLAAVDWCYKINQAGEIRFYGIVKNVGLRDFYLPTQGNFDLMLKWVQNSVHGGFGDKNIDLSKEPNATIKPGSIYVLRQGTKWYRIPLDRNYEVFQFVFSAIADENNKNNVFEEKFNSLPVKWDWFRNHKRDCGLPNDWVEIDIAISNDLNKPCTLSGERRKSVVICREDEIKLCWKSSDLISRIVISNSIDEQEDRYAPFGSIIIKPRSREAENEITYTVKAYDIVNALVASDTVKVIFYKGEELGPFIAERSVEGNRWAAKINEESISQSIRVIAYKLLPCDVKRGKFSLEHYAPNSYTKDYEGAIDTFLKSTKAPSFSAPGEWDFNLLPGEQIPAGRNLCFSFTGTCGPR